MPVFSPDAVLKGAAASVLTYVFLALILATLVYLWDDLEVQLPSLTFAAGLIAAVVGSFLSGRRAGRTGWLHGLLTGALFIIISYYGGALFWPAGTAARLLGRRLLLGMVLGLAGGAVGANL
ncbi:MAG TPA: TIGR04086 family membrane protein [Firmicutes bacterium]|nr:TIGR04086 family membrane protein [Bacillota bacterium]